MDIMYSAHKGSVSIGKALFVKNGVPRDSFRLEDLVELTKEEKKSSDIEYQRALVEDGWNCHPIYKYYFANEGGRVFSLNKRRTISGSVRDNNYVDLRAEGRTLSYHRFVWEACNGSILAEGVEIDHIDKDTQDNRLCNLQPLTRPAHNAKTFECTPESEALSSSSSTLG